MHAFKGEQDTLATIAGQEEDTQGDTGTLHRLLDGILISDIH